MKDLCSIVEIALLHRLGSTGFSFIEIAEQLKNEFRIIAIDAPGHGKTEPFENEEEYIMPSMAQWQNNILNILGIEKFFFLSHSGELFSVILHKEFS